MEVKHLQNIFKSLQTSEAQSLEIETAKTKIRMVQGSQPKAAAPTPEAPKLQEGSTPKPAPDNHIEIRSHYIGFFSRFDPKTRKQYTKLQDKIKKGDVVGIVTSMHVTHDLISDQDGTVHKFLVEEGQPIEYGQPIILLAP